MKEDKKTKHLSITVRMLGPLHAIRKSCGLPTCVEMSVSQEGLQAIDIVRELGLPLEKVGHVFCNNTAYNLEHLVRPGDRVTFVSPWVAGTATKPSDRPYLGGQEKS